jgi:hypothetical protein
MGSMGYPIAYSPRALAKAFDPPLSERLVRAMTILLPASTRQ